MTAAVRPDIPVARVKLRRRHVGQLAVTDDARRFNVLMCGRRFGKTALGIDLALCDALAGRTVGWFAPTYKILSPAWDELVATVAGVPGVRKNEQQKTLTLPGGGSIECWSMDSDDPARSRRYHLIIVDEAGLVPRLAHIWHNALRPTLADFQGGAWFLGTPKGVGDFSALWAQGQGAARDPEWASWRMPTASNPHIQPSEIEAMRASMPDLTYRQEILGEPIDTGEHPIGMDAIAACVAPESREPVVVWGVDLARSIDFTVAVGLDRAGAVASLQRWKAPWNDTKARITRMLGPTIGYVDATGVGDPIVEDLQRAGVRAVGVVFTAREKQGMVEMLIAGIQQRAIQFPDGWLRGELEALRATKTAVGTRYAAPEGLHDDGAMALALAWKGYRETVHADNSARIERGDVPVGVSPGYDYAAQRPRVRESGEQYVERITRRGQSSPLAARYRLPSR